MAYATQAHQQAQRALRELRWTRYVSASCQKGKVVHEHLGASQARDGGARFSALVGGGRQPLPMQRTTIEVAALLRDGGLAIIEAPMGEGKTEAALYLAAAWLDNRRARGAYFALPTQATSDQIDPIFQHRMWSRPSGPPIANAGSWRPLASVLSTRRCWPRSSPGTCSYACSVCERRW